MTRMTLFFHLETRCSQLTLIKNSRILFGKNVHCVNSIREKHSTITNILYPKSDHNYYLVQWWRVQELRHFLLLPLKFDFGGCLFVRGGHAFPIAASPFLWIASNKSPYLVFRQQVSSTEKGNGDHSYNYSSSSPKHHYIGTTTTTHRRWF